MSLASGGGIGSTLTGGIQDIAAILPLLGTEQCSEQVSSALTRGYLYAAATPMSIFGSLGVVIAGFKTFMACLSFRGIEGAKILGNIGFKPQGENLSLIMVEAGKEKGTGGRYIVETRIDKMIEELNIDKNRITEVTHSSSVWNFQMIAATAFLCAFSITPYIHLNLRGNKLNTTTIWIFPALRAAGGFITATLIQLLIQRRITILSAQYLKRLKGDQTPEQDQRRETDVEAAGDTKKLQKVARRISPTWLLQSLLFIGLLASVVGYVGCFSVVQNSTSSSGPVSWLCLEAGLSIMRVVIWAWNPTWDDAPPLEFILKLDKHKPLPTCNKDNEEILRQRVLPLTRAQDFLKIITSFAGLIEPFRNSGLSLYYTLTRRHLFEETAPQREFKNAYVSDEEWERRNNETENAELGERTLYITVFDHRERTTRVYTRVDDMDLFFSTKSDAPLVDVGHFRLEVEIDAEIEPEGDPISRDSDNVDSLRNHHQSVLECIQYRLGAGEVVPRYAIENGWTMEVEDTISTFQRLRKENRDDWDAAVKKGKEEERDEVDPHICDYFMHASIERQRRLLDEGRVEWIARRMEMITKERKESCQGETRPVDAQEMERMLEREPHLMMKLLIYEVRKWDELFWNKFKTFLDQIGNDRVEEKERCRREWKANHWKRMESLRHTAVEKIPEVKDEEWAYEIRRLFEGVEASTLLSELRDDVDTITRIYDVPEIRLRMEKEMEDVHFRLKRGSDLGRFDQFWDEDDLFNCRYSRSKWVRLVNREVPVEVYLHALKGNRNIIHVSFSPYSDVKEFHAAICDLPPWVTSISCYDYRFRDLPAINRDLLFNSAKNDLITFAKETRLKLDSSSSYIFTDANFHTMIYGCSLWCGARVLISFVGPTSRHLTLRFKYSGKEGSLEVTLGSTTTQINNPSPKPSESLTIGDITLHPIQVSGPSESHHLLFEPGIRNELFIQYKKESYYVPVTLSLHDVELLDEDGLQYMPRTPSLSITV
jgi:hypothetical protein